LVGMVLGKIWIDDYRARTRQGHGPRTRGESPKAGEGGHQPQVRGHARTRARGRKAVRRHESP
jgi:hypothetical protein